MATVTVRRAPSLARGPRVRGRQVVFEQAAPSPIVAGRGTTGFNASAAAASARLQVKHMQQAQRHSDRHVEAAPPSEASGHRVASATPDSIDDLAALEPTAAEELAYSEWSQATPGSSAGEVSSADEDNAVAGAAAATTTTITAVATTTLHSKADEARRASFPDVLRGDHHKRMEQQSQRPQVHQQHPPRRPARRKRPKRHVKQWRSFHTGSRRLGTKPTPPSKSQSHYDMTRHGKAMHSAATEDEASPFSVPRQLRKTSFFGDPRPTVLAATSVGGIPVSKIARRAAGVIMVRNNQATCVANALTHLVHMCSMPAPC